MNDNELLMQRGLERLLEAQSTRVLVADLRGKILRRHEGRAGARFAPAPTLRALWEQEQPARIDSAQPIAFLDTPAMRALAGNSIENEAARVTRANLTLDTSTSARPVFDDANAVIGVLVLERSATPAAEHSQTSAHGVQRAKEAQAAHEERLAAIATFASGLLHDVNNTLNPIMSSAYLLAMRADEPDAVREYAERIRAAADEGAALAARVGRFIRQQPLPDGGDERVDLVALANDILDGFAPLQAALARGHGAVRVVRELAQPVIVHGLRAELRLAVEALIQNAIDATDATPESAITVRVFRAGNEAELEVGDNGDGMTAEVRSHAFDPFYTTRRVDRVGLGLAETHGIAKRHSGYVRLTSVIGAGTTAALVLPTGTNATAAADSAASTVEPPANAPLLDTGAAAIAVDTPLRVLVVEDHDVGRELLRRLLETGGHHVETVGGVAAAHEKLANTATPYHLLLTDVTLPDGLGWDLAAQAHKQWPRLRIGVVTGWDASDDEAKPEAVEFVLQKPLRGAELLARVAGRKKSTITQ